jgi:hypothetical protein
MQAYNLYYEEFIFKKYLDIENPPNEWGLILKFIVIRQQNLPHICKGKILVEIPTILFHVIIKRSLPGFVKI